MHRGTRRKRRMIDHEEKLRIMALAIRKGIDVRGPEAVSILEDAADYIQFLFEEWGREDEAEAIAPEEGE
tara:strand:- start:94 stop:303 length:210 start_codon:yes stop_codon:yes gene_type:complete